jgi:ABC-type thiamin/hydroxymethylpyrimidine transport system permease subunit
MKRAMDAPPAPGTSNEGGLTLKRIMLPYLWRALAIWAICALAAAALYRAVRHRSWWRLLLNGLGAALVGLITGWTLDTDNGLLALAVPIALFGVPGAMLTLWRSRSLREAGMVMGAWVLASVAAALAVRPLG